MKIEKSIEYPIKWEQANIGDVAKMIRITSEGESIILKGEAVFSHRDRHAVYNHEISFVSKEQTAHDNKMNEKEASEKIDQIWGMINDYADSSGTIKAVGVFQAICKVVTPSIESDNLKKVK